MPSYTSKNYLNSSAEDYTFYMRKHNPLGIYDSVSQNEARQGRIRNFNDFANDIVNGSLSQWIFVTPNMVHLIVAQVSFMLNTDTGQRRSRHDYRLRRRLHRVLALPVA